MTREDPFLFEANRHVQARNAAWTRDIREAWFENRLLDKYFAAALDTPSYAVPAGSRWPDEQRRDADARRQAVQSSAPFISQTLRDYVIIWPKSVVWGAALVLAIGCLIAGNDLRGHFRSSPPGYW